MKHVKKLVAVALIAMSMMAVGALAEDMTVELGVVGQAAEVLLVTDEVSVSTETATHWVRFYDAQGVEIAAIEVKAGEALPALETIAGLEGIDCGVWHDMADETKAAYVLEAAVHGDIALVMGETTETEMETIDALAEQILGGAVVTEEAAEETELVEMLAGQILGGVAVAEETDATEEIAMQILGSEAAMTEETTEVDALAEQILSVVESSEEASEETIIAEEPEVMEEALEEIAEEMVPLAGPALAPSVEVVCDYEGELKAGTEVTVRAIVHNLPEMYEIEFQWQNDATGMYADVSGATGESFTFVVDEFHAEGCNWRVNATIHA